MDISLKDDDYDRSGTGSDVDTGEGQREGGDVQHGVVTVYEPIVIDKEKRDAVVAMFKVGWYHYFTVFS
jgi:hypothetical protein